MSGKCFFNLRFAISPFFQTAVLHPLFSPCHFWPRFIFAIFTIHFDLIFHITTEFYSTSTRLITAPTAPFPYRITVLYIFIILYQIGAVGAVGAVISRVNHYSTSKKGAVGAVGLKMPNTTITKQPTSFRFVILIAFFYFQFCHNSGNFHLGSFLATTHTIIVKLQQNISSG